MKIKIDKDYRKFFKNTGTYITKYQLFIHDTNNSIEWEKKDLPIVLDDSKYYYLINTYGEDLCGVVEVRKRKAEWGLGLVLNTANVAVWDGEYGLKTGINVTLYGTFSEESCKKRIIRALEKYIAKHQWILNIKVDDIVKAMN